MRALHSISNSFLDFIENTQVGSRLFRLARLSFFALVILVVSRKASSQFLSFSFSDVLFMALTALAFLVVMWRWEIGILMALGTTSFIAYYDVMPTLSLYHFIPEIPILEDLRLLLGQGLMLFLLALFATSLELRTLRQRLATPLAPAVLAFLIAILVASLNGVFFRDVTLTKMVETARSYSFYLMFFVTLLCIRDRRALDRLLAVAFVMAVIVSILMFVQFAAGERFRVFLGRSVRVETFGGYSGRILPPGTELIWMSVPFVMSRIPLVSRRLSRLLMVGLGLLLGGLLLTFTRSVWMGTLLSMTVMAVLGRGAIRRGVMRMFVVLAAFVTVLLMVLSLVSTENNDYMRPYVERFTSIFDPESYEEGSSAEARWVEISAAWPNIVRHPWLGIGVGGIYRQTEEWDRSSERLYMRGVSYIHNAYILLLTHTGILGLGTCLVMFLVFFVRARKIFHELEDPTDRSLVMASIGTMASVLLASIMQPSLWYPPAVPCIGVIFGIMELTRFFREREARGTGVLPAVSTGLAPGRRTGPAFRAQSPALRSAPLSRPPVAPLRSRRST